MTRFDHIDATQATHIQTRNTSGQVCTFKRDTLGWTWAKNDHRISDRFLGRIVNTLHDKPGASVVAYTPKK